MNAERAIALRRLLAFALDGLVVAAWGGALFGAVMIATHGQPAPPQGPWKAQAIGFAAMTGPVALYFALCESSGRAASLGKRALGLVVSGAGGGRLAFSPALLRNLVKFVPWECGHTLAQQAAFSGEAGLSGWVAAPALGAFAVPLWWLAALLATGRTPYDGWTSTRVARGSRPRAAIEA